MTQQQNSVFLPERYRPSTQEDYMNPQQREYFRCKLLAWKAEILGKTRATLHTLQKEAHKEPEQGDRASRELERSIELRARDRHRKLLLKIDHALQLIFVMVSRLSCRHFCIQQRLAVSGSCRKKSLIIFKITY